MLPLFPPGVELAHKVLAASSQLIELHCVWKDQGPLLLSQLAEIDLVDEFNEEFNEGLVAVARNHLVYSLCPEPVLDLCSGPLVDLVLGLTWGDAMVLQVTGEWLHLWGLPDIRGVEEGRVDGEFKFCHVTIVLLSKRMFDIPNKRR